MLGAQVVPDVARAERWRSVEGSNSKAPKLLGSVGSWRARARGGEGREAARCEWPSGFPGQQHRHHP